MGELEAELAPGTRVGEFVLGGLLGSGGMATVYSATHPVIGKQAAVKVIHRHLCTDASCVERFVREARAVNRIGHPNIVDIFSFGGLPDGRSYLIMEWLKGETLAQRIESRLLHPREIVDLLQQISDALAGAHAHGIVHRDIKPENVFLVSAAGGRDRVKLLDFGIAKLLGFDRQEPGAPNSLPLTERNSIIGTPEYLAPEQARGRYCDSRTDVYSLGVMAYEMATGARPFQGADAIATVQMHLFSAVPRPRLARPDLPDALEQLILSMLEKDVGQRPRIAEVQARLAMLDVASVDSPARAKGAAVPAPVTESLPRVRSRWLGTSARIVAGLAMLLLFGAFHLALRSETPIRRIEKRSLAPGLPLLPTPATLIVSIEGGARARVVLDGQPIAEGVTRLRLGIADAGEHTVEASAPGRRSARQRVSVEAGTTTQVQLSLPHLRLARRPHGEFPDDDFFPRPGHFDQLFGSFGMLRR